MDLAVAAGPKSKTRSALRSLAPTVWTIFLQEAVAAHLLSNVAAVAAPDQPVHAIDSVAVADVVEQD